VPLPEVCAALAIAAELGLGLLLVVGWQARWAALGLAIFVAVITPIFHNYWAMPEAQVMMQKQAFNKNLAVVGGLLVLAAFGAGRFSLEGRRARA
jgi:putative oxidoreductase